MLLLMKMLIFTNNDIMQYLQYYETVYLHLHDMMTCSNNGNKEIKHFL